MYAEEQGSPANQPQGPFEVTLEYTGPAVMMWLWSNAHSTEDSGLRAGPIKHTAGETGELHTDSQPATHWLTLLLGNCSGTPPDAFASGVVGVGAGPAGGDTGLLHSDLDMPTD